MSHCHCTSYGEKQQQAGAPSVHTTQLEQQTQLTHIAYTHTHHRSCVVLGNRASKKYESMPSANYSDIDLLFELIHMWLTGIARVVWTNITTITTQTTICGRIICVLLIGLSTTVVSLRIKTKKQQKNTQTEKKEKVTKRFVFE